jgi:DNA polymerase-1
MMKLLLVDGNAVLHRAYYALPDWRNRSGEATAGVYGFLSVLLKSIEELQPTHLTVVFDNPEPTFRHLMYVGYQSNREKDRQVSEDIWGQVEKLKIVFEKMKVPVFSLAGFEADDVIGTISKQAEEGGFEAVIITGDKDLMQLVDEKIKLFMPQKGLSDGVLIDEDRVLEKLGIHPNQVIDYKALVGDSSDNYPGVTGIGPKTATHLLSEYGNFDGVYKSLGSIGEKIREKLVVGFEGGELSRRLATINRDVPVTWHEEKSMVPTMDKIVGVLKELGYKSLIRRAGGKTEEADDGQTKLFE